MEEGEGGGGGSGSSLVEEAASAVVQAASEAHPTLTSICLISHMTLPMSPARPHASMTVPKWYDSGSKPVRCMRCSKFCAARDWPVRAHALSAAVYVCFVGASEGSPSLDASSSMSSSNPMDCRHLPARDAAPTAAL